MGFLFSIFNKIARANPAFLPHCLKYPSLNIITAEFILIKISGNRFFAFSIIPWIYPLVVTIPIISLTFTAISSITPGHLLIASFIFGSNSV